MKNLLNMSNPSRKQNSRNLLFMASILFFMLFVRTATIAQTANCDYYIGKWETPDKDVIEIFKTSSGEFKGKLIKLGTPNDESGNPWRDENNPNKSLRNRLVKGIIILEGLECNPKKSKLEDGEVYLPEEGEKLSCSLMLLSKNSLIIKVSAGIFSDMEGWKRIP